MIYKQFQDMSLSALGLGCMRLPTIDGDGSKIDEKKSAEMVEYAMKNGINYYDTAWGYHGGNSEIVMGKILKSYPRESFYLASKFPGYELSNHGKVEEIFERQLQKCQVDYFDFYLIHSVTEANIGRYLDPKYGTLAYVLEQKKNGRIRHLGFSFHGNADVMRRFLEVYGDYMEFGQLQLGINTVDPCAHSYTNVQVLTGDAVPEEEKPDYSNYKFFVDSASGGVTADPEAATIAISNTVSKTETMFKANAEETHSNKWQLTGTVTKTEMKNLFLYARIHYMALRYPSDHLSP